jgi:hypothetical protein
VASAGRETEHHDSTWARLFTAVNTPLLRCAIAGGALQASPTGYDKGSGEPPSSPFFILRLGKHAPPLARLIMTTYTKCWIDLCRAWWQARINDQLVSTSTKEHA